MDLEKFDSLADEVRRAHDEPPPPPPPAAPSRIKPTWLAIAILIALVLAESVLLLRVNSTDDQRNDIVAVARKLVTLVTNYDASTITGQRPQVLALATGRFHDDFEQRTGPAFNKVIADTKTTSTGTVRLIGITSLKGNNADVIVLLDHTLKNNTLKTPKVEPTVITLSLVHTAGGWRVDDFRVQGVLTFS